MMEVFVELCKGLWQSWVETKVSASISRQAGRVKVAVYIMDASLFEAK